MWPALAERYTCLIDVNSEKCWAGTIVVWSPDAESGIVVRLTCADKGTVAMTVNPVLVYGATGTQGGPVVERFLAAERPVRVLTREADRARRFEDRGAEIAVADLGDLDSLRAAHRGIDRVILHLPLQYDFDLHERYGRNAVRAAREAGVSMLVFNTSAHVLNEPAVTVYRVRQEMVDHLQDSGVPNIVLRPTFYLDNFLGPWIRPGIVDNGVLAFALPPDLPMSWISADEAAAYAVAAVDRPDLAGSVFDIGGPEPVTGKEIAATFGDVLGRQVQYVAIEPDAYENALVPIFGPAVASEVAQQVRCIIDRGDGSVDMTDVRRHLKVPPLALRTWIAQQSWN